MKKLAILITLLMLAGCSMPVTTVQTVDTRPSISIIGASEAAELYVDGINMGKAASFDAPNQLKLTPGTHRISIIESGQTTIEKTIFIESEHKNIIAR
jgi:uncharacterized lipoprotein YajG